RLTPRPPSCSIREPSIRLWTRSFAKSGKRLLRSHWRPDKHRSAGGKRVRARPAARGFRAGLLLLSLPHFQGVRHGTSTVSHSISTSLADCLPRFLQIISSWLQVLQISLTS